MASAAAVATDISKSPIPDQEVDETLNTVGGITRADHFRSQESASEEEDDDITRPTRRKLQTNGVNPDAPNDEEDLGDDDDADLFGSGSEAGEPQRERGLDDEDLDSGDDEDRDDRRLDDSQAQGDHAVQEVQGMDIDLGRAPIPEPSDGEVCTPCAPCCGLSNC